ncbi:hypothetical protein [Streptomyces sp. PgraA7]|uniref:hypothetical protein n=1 Tax=unclassified Streptomyces TaxID=2593676 RepID=UPI000B50F536|nr:hypothetical protein [Streptomyces sp. PgraA7]MYW99929.1 hypothetical protein [Streptomyces sp. SID8378]SNB89896.1 hypothetical protein SAMN02745831_06190 [Streptomyces sp. PgraA7]
MPTHPLITWAVDHPWPAAGITAAALAVLGAALWAIVRTARSIAWPPAPVLVAGAGALVCTAYSGDTSWRFAGERLGMVDSTERALMFGAGELALLACAVMARANKAATATESTAGSAGVPGVLVWVITGVQVIPCYATSGIVGGTVRAVIGPVLAGLLWHLAMGLEIRVARPEALSTGLPAVIGRELRERLLSRLGLATRDRTAEQITRDRATARAVHLAAVLELRPGGWLSGYRRRRLAAAVARSGAGTNGEQRHRLLQQLAARRTSGQLATVPLASPWAGTPVPGEAYPRTPLGVTGAQLRAMDPLAVVHLVRAAHPTVEPAGIATLCTEYGVPVSETQVRIALRAGNSLTAATPPALVRPVPDPAPVVPGGVRLLPVTCRPAVPRPAPAVAATHTRTRPVVTAEYVPEEAVPAPGDVPDEDVPQGDCDVPDPDPFIEQARRDFGTDVPGIRPLRARYGIGQKRAQHIRNVLGGTP